MNHRPTLSPRLTKTTPTPTPTPTTKTETETETETETKKTAAFLRRRSASARLACLLLALTTLPAGATPGHAPFVVEPALTEASSLRGVVAGDLDGDGDLDLVYTDPDADAVRWLEQPDDGGPWTERAVNMPATAPLGGAHGVAVADLDGDGDLDIVVSARTAGTVEAWFNDDGLGGSWTRQTVAPDAQGVRAVAVADLDLDGRPDIVAAVTGADALRWWRQTASGWAGRVVDGAAGGARHLCLVDVDGDGDRDLVASSPDAGVISWWDNPRLPAASGWTETPIANLTSPGALACADLTRDGVPDVLVAHATSSLALLVQAAPSSWLALSVGDPGDVTAITAVGLADLDRDGLLDPVAASGDPLGLTWFSINRDSGEFEPLSTTPDDTGRVLPNFLAADLDGDGDIDLAGLESIDGADDALVLERQRDLGRTPAARLVDAATVAGSSSLREPVRHDVDGDGDLDLVSLEEQGGGGAFTLTWMENPGAPGDGPEPPALTRHEVTDAGGLPETFIASDLVLGDFDADGDDDILVGEYDSAVRCFDFCENLDGAGTAWDCQLRVPTGNLSLLDIVGPMTTGDFDGDGDLDLAAVASGFGDPSLDGLYWFENLGDLSQMEAFTEHLISTSQPASDVAARDLDGDGDLDLLALRDGDLVGFDNQGGTWSEDFEIDTGLAVEELETTDWDGDGDLDVVVRKAESLALYLRDAASPGSAGSYTYVPLYGVAKGVTSVELGGLELADLDQDGDTDVLTSFGTISDGETEPGGLLVRLNRWNEPDPDSENFGSLLSTLIVPAPTAATHVAALDLDGDGRRDFVYRVIGATEEAIPNVAGNLAVDGLDISPASVVAGEQTGLLQLLPRHLGRAGDQAIAIDGFDLTVSDDDGPLDQVAVETLLGAVELRLADGTENSSYGQLVARWSSTVVTNGVAAFELVDSDIPATPPLFDPSNVHVPQLTIVLDFGLDAPSALSGPLRVSVATGGVGAFAALSDTPVLQVPIDRPEAELVVLLNNGVLFTDGFENGSTSAWGAVFP